MKVLAVDNEQNPLQMLKRAICTNLPDCELACFMNPTEALEWAKVNQPEIAFLDIEMPVLNGIVLGKMLKAANPKVNLIYVTGYYEEYMGQALPIRFSGYLQKPVTAEEVQTELENLRYPVQLFESAKTKLVVKCFGTFEVYYDHRPLRFARSKTKELFAFLVDCRGIAADGEELCATLFGDLQSTGSRKSALRNCVADLRHTLESVGMEKAFKKGFNTYAIDTAMIDCDYYRWNKNDADAVRAFQGAYMSQYPWGEDTLLNILLYQVYQER